MKRYEIYIGIDCGVNTGMAVWNSSAKKLQQVSSLKIHQALKQLESYSNTSMLVRVEDARMRKWFGKAGQEQLQGAGSIKRDCKIWEDYLTDNKIPFELVAPKNNKTKLTADVFARMTGWTGKTNEHSRDAAMLVFGI